MTDNTMASDTTQNSSTGSTGSSNGSTGSSTGRSNGSDSAPGRSYLFFIAFMVALSAFGSFVNDMYTPSFPELTRAFHTSVSMVQLGLTAGMIGLALGQFLMGPVSDRCGRKPILFISLGIFLVGAFIAVRSESIQTFLFARLVQGVGASGGYFLARSIPADIYGGRQLAKAMALIGAINGFAPASAPIIGGFVAESFTWKGIFILLGLLACVLLVMSIFYKESLPKAKRLTGSFLTGFREYPQLLHNRKFMTHVLLKASALGLLFAYVSATPFIFQDHYGYSESEYGIFIGVNSLFTAAGSMIALRFRVLKDAAWVGGWLLVISTGITAGIMWLIDDFWAFEISLLPMLFSMGMIFTVGNTLAMNEGRQSAGSASAILGIMGYIFGAIVAPLVGLGDIMHSASIAFGVLAVTTFCFAFASRKFAPDLGN